ncbi:MAG: GNAT family N-acetyltransferase [Nitrospinae bacterium]|nr:GNAT family N-acetyltransferase [Nitrospinota bacterium]
MDIIAIRDIVASTGFFNEEEIDIAVELVEERLARGEKSGYYFVFAQTPDGRVAGYACYGPISGTKSSFDLYWIAVHNDERGKGLGPAIMEKAEKAMADMGAVQVYAETSSRAQYKPTRSFYEKQGYVQTALMEDFYDEGDGKVVYVKKLR